MPAIEVNDLSREFNGFTAVNNVSFNVEEGEVFGILGPNGAGKSTLINMLVTLLDSTSGDALVNGFNINQDKHSVRESLGIVFQEEAIDEELTGEENLEFHARLYGLDREKRRMRVDEVLELVGLEDVRGYPVESYSGGMKRRLEIGRGLVSEPAVLFLDEPTVGLDARTRRDTWQYIQRMNREENVTIVLTTHYIEEADHLCDRVAVMDEGEIIAIDDPEILKASLGGDIVICDMDGDLDSLSEELGSKGWVTNCKLTDPGIHITLDNGDARVVEVVRIADKLGVGINSVEVRKPSLEDVFLDLTGSRIKEKEQMEAEKEAMDVSN